MQFPRVTCALETMHDSTIQAVQLLVDAIVAELDSKRARIICRVIAGNLRNQADQLEAFGRELEQRRVKDIFAGSS